VTVLFEFDDVHVDDGGYEILRGVTMVVPEGGITVVTGPSGSGKSTLLRLCNRLVVASSGRLLLRGRDLMDRDPIELRREVGMVFQRPTPFPGTVRDNLRAAATLDDAACGALLDRVGLSRELLDRDALTLSGGEAQRMCLARTLATGCQVVLADECTSSLDGDATAVVEATARHLADGGATVVWVTHDEEQAGRLADHRVRIEEGRVVD
jgi:putative ABC transport system ATP-binding protein